jgi:hypothetical protein
MRAAGSALLTLLVCPGFGEIARAQSLGEHAQPIVGGSASGDEQNAAVLIMYGSFLDYCTGIAVAPTLVLTARHCLFDVVRGENEFVHCERPNDVASVLAARRADMLTVRVGSSKPLPPEPTAIGIGVYSSDDLDLCQNDLALLELDRPLPVPPLPLRLDAPPGVGEVGTLIGWGFAEQDGPSLAETRQQREIRIESLGPNIYTPEGGPPRNIRESAFVGTEGACTGDNGGPLVSLETGAVIGVMSDIDNTDAVVVLDAMNNFKKCVDGISQFQRLDLQEGWLRRVFRDRGLNPWLEGKSRPAAIGVLCTDGDECLSGLCLSLGAQSVCSVGCSIDPCPVDMECVGPLAERVCVPSEVPGAALDATSCRLSAAHRAPSAAIYSLAISFLVASFMRRWRRQ